MDLVDRIVAWIRSRLEATGLRGVVFGLSGGLDSAVTGALCKKAAGDGALGLIMPCHSDQADLEDAELVARTFGIETRKIDLGPVYDLLVETLPEADGKTRANVKPRLRMTVLYYFANKNKYLVVGTGNKSEFRVGYFTKYGDGGADLFPLAGLYKTELRSFAGNLGVPESIINKPPSAGLWEGQTDEGEMGVSYEELDEILEAMEEGREPGAPPEAVERVRGMVRSQAHKTEPVPGFEP